MIKTARGYLLEDGSLLVVIDGEREQRVWSAQRFPLTNGTTPELEVMYNEWNSSTPPPPCYPSDHRLRFAAIRRVGDNGWVSVREWCMTTTPPPVC